MGFAVRCMLHSAISHDTFYSMGILLVKKDVYPPTPIISGIGSDGGMNIAPPLERTVPTRRNELSSSQTRTRDGTGSTPQGINLRLAEDSYLPLVSQNSATWVVDIYQGRPRISLAGVLSESYPPSGE